MTRESLFLPLRPKWIGLILRARPGEGAERHPVRVVHPGSLEPKNWDEAARDR
jgi:hypothetical protein